MNKEYLISAINSKKREIGVFYDIIRDYQATIKPNLDSDDTFSDETLNQFVNYRTQNRIRNREDSKRAIVNLPVEKEENKRIRINLDYALVFECSNIYEFLDEKLEAERLKRPLNYFLNFIRHFESAVGKIDNFPALLSNQFKSKEEIEKASKVLALMSIYMDDTMEIYNGHSIAKEIKSMKLGTPESELLSRFDATTTWSIRDASIFCGIEERTINSWKHSGKFRTANHCIYIKSLIEYLKESQPKYFSAILEREYS